jgi:hypothetical protein
MKYEINVREKTAVYRIVDSVSAFGVRRSAGRRGERAKVDVVD